MKIPTLACVFAALLPLGGCAPASSTAPAAPSSATAAAVPGKPATSKKLARAAAAAAGKPAQPLAPVPGAAATIAEADTGKTVRIAPGQAVAIRLAVTEATGNRWFQSNALLGGVLGKKGATTYSQTVDGTVATLLYEGLHAGSQELHFSYAPPDARQNATRTADFRVIVK